MTLFIYEGFGQKVLMYYFALLLMKNIPQPYSFFHRVSAIMMIVALSWLTISAPFVYEQQQKIAKENSSGFANLPIAGTDEEANPFSGSTEEKAPKTASLPKKEEAVPVKKRCKQEGQQEKGRFHEGTGTS